MEFNRTVNAKRTIITGTAFRIFSMIVPFFMRTLIIYTFGNLYLGLNSLFASILNALSLAELGIGSAMVFAMYRPVAHNDRDQVSALLNAYRIAYYGIGAVIMTFGLAILPFIPRMIHGEYPSDINIYIIYLIHLAAAVAGYFFMAYKTSIFQVYQRIDIVNMVSMVSDTLTYAIQAVSLLIFHNYYVYTCALVFRSIVQNLIISCIAAKKYPDITPAGSISRSAGGMILRKTGALVGHKVGGVVVNSVDNILISSFIGLNIVAIYNNYFYVVTALSGLFLMLTNGLTAIVGNYIIEKEPSETYKLFHFFHYCIAFAACYCCTCLLNMFQPFVSVWIGKSSLLPFNSVVLFTVYFFIIKIKTVGLLFKDAAGLWEKDVLKPYIQIIIDIVIDLILLRTIGINGAIISSIACMLFGYFYETVVVFKYCIHSSPGRYYLNTALYFIATFISCIISLIACRISLIENGIAALFFSFLVSSAVSIITFVVCTFRTSEFSDASHFIKKRIIGNALKKGD